MNISMLLRERDMHAVFAGSVAHAIVHQCLPASRAPHKGWRHRSILRRCRMARKATAAKAKSNSPELTKDEELHAFREMLLIRRFEEKAGQMYGMGLIGGFCHLYIGQEAVVTGITMASKKGEDAQITGYRDHGHMLV